VPRGTVEFVARNSVLAYLTYLAYLFEDGVREDALKIVVYVYIGYPPLRCAGVLKSAGILLSWAFHAACLPFGLITPLFGRL
jgi:hypothetical protein